MISVTINGKTVAVAEGTTVLQAARQAGEHIPTLCDHPSLKPFGGCRLCVVEVQGMRTLQASCTLPAADGMVVNTETPQVNETREFVLDMIFSERNHFCMYCQKSGGDCELQNEAYALDMTHWPLQPGWSPFNVDSSSPYFIFDHNRCILCRRCVRACGELVGNHTLGMENRGTHTMVVADAGVSMGESSCVSCGTCVQVCPTGALIDRRSAYLGLNAKTEQTNSVCVGCSVGCGVKVFTRDNQLVRLEGDWEAPVNQGVLCEFGRYKNLEMPGERVRTPLVRKNGSLVPATWEEALDVTASHLRQQPAAVAALASTRLPAEALYAFADLFSAKTGVANATAIEENVTHAELNDPALTGSLEALQASDCVVLLGSDLSRFQRVVGFMVRRQQASGTRLVVIDPADNGMSLYADAALQPAPASLSSLLKDLQNAVANLRQNPEGTVSVEIARAARLLAAAQRPVIVLGMSFTSQATPDLLQALQCLARQSGAVLLNARGKANSLAAQRYGLTSEFRPQGMQSVFLALGDDIPTPRLLELVKAAPFLAVQASYTSPLTEQADVVLPVAMWAEQAGHYLNMEARLQPARQVLTAPDGVRSNLAVLEALAQCMGVTIDNQWEEALC